MTPSLLRCRSRTGSPTGRAPKPRPMANRNASGLQPFRRRRLTYTIPSLYRPPRNPSRPSSPSPSLYRPLLSRPWLRRRRSLPSRPQHLRRPSRPSCRSPRSRHPSLPPHLPARSRSSLRSTPTRLGRNRGRSSRRHRPRPLPPRQRSHQRRSSSRPLQSRPAHPSPAGRPKLTLPRCRPKRRTSGRQIRPPSARCPHGHRRLSSRSRRHPLRRFRRGPTLSAQSPRQAPRQ